MEKSNQNSMKKKNEEDTSDFSKPRFFSHTALELIQ
uniref:Uncharacterized protein n=1 Tax=Arundo donax TaxID=35708 RepID=A0A0A9FVH2_ARUDO